MSVAALSLPLARPAPNPWLVAAAVVVPTFMEVLDTTIANVALHYIAGGLKASVVDSEWIITSYLAANATILPISGWLSAHLGRRRYFLISIAVFTIASFLCARATSLEGIILFRVIQGLAGGGLQPSSQGVLLDSFPPEKQGAAMTIFGMAALVAPIVGPTLGGYLTDTYNWRWIFYINIPIGTVAFAACYVLLEDPEYLKQERAELKKRPLQFDAIGLGLLAIALSCWEVMLSKGQQWDWLGDPFWRVQTLVIVFVFSLGILIFREMRIANPVVNFRPLAERNLAICSIIIFCAYAVLYAASTSLPGLLQTLFGYDAYRSGLVMSPSGIGSVSMLLLVGVLLSRGVDARWLIAAGLLVAAAGNYWMSLTNLEISPWQVVWPRVVLAMGLGLLFAPINVAAYLYTPRHLRGAAVGLFALLRNEGGSVGTSMAQTFQERRDQFHTLRLGELIDPLNPDTNSFLEQARAFFFQQTGDSALSQQMAWQALADLREQQASSLSYFDIFWIITVLPLVLVGLVFFMKRSVAERVRTSAQSEQVRSMLTALRQYLVILAIAMWLGGFTFYAVVVVPTGADVLGGSEEQGFVTQVVTRHLNWIALAALVILLWNVVVQRGTALTATWVGMLLAQAALFWMHSVLDQRLDPQTHEIADDFHFLHEAYLWVSAAQWLLGLAHVWFVLAGWRKSRPAT